MKTMWLMDLIPWLDPFPVVRPRQPTSNATRTRVPADAKKLTVLVFLCRIRSPTQMLPELVVVGRLSRNSRIKPHRTCCIKVVMRRCTELLLVCVVIALLLILPGCGGSSNSGSSGPMNNNSAPVITAQPANQTVAVGQTATFSVTATGMAPLSYQWQKNGTNISGATGSSYTTPPVTNADNGAQFKVVVSNSQGNVTSNS